MNNNFMELAIKEAYKNANNNFQDGGPFGAIIVKDGQVIASAHNTVLTSQDPTAHAEINAIRLATKKLNTYDLKDCIMYASSEPCPMCLSAIIWANIKTIYYTNNKEEANNIGFRDNIIYEYLNNKDSKVLNMIKIDNEEAKKLFAEFKNNHDKKIY